MAKKITVTMVENYKGLKIYQPVSSNFMESSKRHSTGLQLEFEEQPKVEAAPVDPSTIRVTDKQFTRLNLV